MLPAQMQQAQMQQALKMQHLVDKF